MLKGCYNKLSNEREVQEMEIRVNVRKVMNNQSEITVYVNDKDMSATDVVCIIHHLCYYGTMTSLSASYPYKTLKIFVMNEDVSILFKSLEDEGFTVVMA